MTAYPAASCTVWSLFCRHFNRHLALATMESKTDQEWLCLNPSLYVSTKVVPSLARWAAGYLCSVPCGTSGSRVSAHSFRITSCVFAHLRNDLAPFGCLPAAGGGQAAFSPARQIGENPYNGSVTNMGHCAVQLQRRV